MQQNRFETTSKKLEEFLYLHDIHWLTSYRNEDGLLVWVYDFTAETKHVVDEFRQIISRRKARRA